MNVQEAVAVARQLKNTQEPVALIKASADAVLVTFAAGDGDPYANLSVYVDRADPEVSRAVSPGEWLDLAAGMQQVYPKQEGV